MKVPRSEWWGCTSGRHSNQYSVSDENWPGGNCDCLKEKNMTIKSGNVTSNSWIVLFIIALTK